MEALREARTLNPHPDAVRDEEFGSSGFFDARDLVQVKYEMVRRVQAEGMPVTSAARAFGFSRPSYYQAAAALARAGLPGLVPAKPGPRSDPGQRPALVLPALPGRARLQHRLQLTHLRRGQLARATTRPL